MWAENKAYPTRVRAGRLGPGEWTNRCSELDVFIVADGGGPSPENQPIGWRCPQVAVQSLGRPHIRPVHWPTLAIVNSASHEVVDAVVVGAGFAGLYALTGCASRG